ncbi:craniofacial development protein 2-like [Mytilus edulis]|uniref:craniofacial development protein 2-like n=1 Tax=Mytilus edulis TaxID=6550 RepID=UPI0039F00D8C
MHQLLNEVDIETKTDFFEKLRSEMEGVLTHDVVLVNGDLDAKAGSDNIGVERIMGNNGCGTCKENGNLLIEFCGLNDLVIGGTMFQHNDIHKLTWTSPNRRGKNQIDHLMINGRWWHSLKDVSVKRGTYCGSDRYLIIGKIKLKPKKAPKMNELSRKTFDLQILKDNKIRQKFNTEVKKKIPSTS